MTIHNLTEKNLDWVFGQTNNKTIHGKNITFETRIFEIPEQGIELKVFANDVFIIYYNIYKNKKYDFDVIKNEKDVIEYTENCLKQNGFTSLNGW